MSRFFCLGGFCRTLSERNGNNVHMIVLQNDGIKYSIRSYLCVATKKFALFRYILHSGVGDYRTDRNSLLRYMVTDRRYYGNVPYNRLGYF